VRNAEFSSTLARVLHRPAIFPAPPFALRLALGELADSLLLASQKVYPTKLQRLGYRFLFPDLQPALAAVLQ
jgi:NAD dependent epimerase/dehydratase family enzyme